MKWLSSSAIVFPLAVVIVAVTTFGTVTPDLAIGAFLLIALAPWALVALEIDLPPMALVVTTVVVVGWLVLRLDDAGTMFFAVVAISWAGARGARLATVVCFVGSAGVVIAAAAMHHDSFVHEGTIAWTTGIAMGAFFGVLLNHQRQLTDDLSEARHELGLAAIREERTMVAREVHDIVGHGLTVALLNISGARRQLARNPDAAAEALDRAEAVTRDSLETVRNVVGLLSSRDQRYEPMPGGADVVAIIEQAKRSGLPVSATIEGDPAALDPAVGLTLVRLLQESLSNANRHAPGSPIDISLRVAEQNVTTVVGNALRRDADIRPDVTEVDRRGLGIASMTDRVAAVRGTLEIGARDGRWIVHCVLPRAAHAGRPTGLSPT